MTSHPRRSVDRWLRRAVVAAFVLASSALWWPYPAQAAAAGAGSGARAGAGAGAGATVRLKEVASVQGVRNNALTGYGLVVGLDGTGDQTTQAPFTSQALQSMLQQMGISLPPGVALQVRNVAAVLVTAQLPAFA